MRRPLFVVASAIIFTAHTSAFDLKTGQPFPNVPLPTTADARLTSIADFRGQNLMLHLFASW